MITLIFIAVVVIFALGLYCGWHLKSLHARDVELGLKCDLDAVKQALEKERLK